VYELDWMILTVGYCLRQFGLQLHNSLSLVQKRMHSCTHHW